MDFLSFLQQKQSTLTKKLSDFMPKDEWQDIELEGKMTPTMERMKIAGFSPPKEVSEKKVSLPEPPIKITPIKEIIAPITDSEMIQKMVPPPEAPAWYSRFMDQVKEADKKIRQKEYEQKIKGEKVEDFLTTLKYLPEEMYKAGKFFVDVLDPRTRDKYIEENPEEVINYVTAYENIWIPFLRKSYPSRIPLAVAEKFVGKKLASTYNEVAERAPVSTAIGGLLGDIYNLVALNYLTKGLPLIVKTPGWLKASFPFISQFVPKAIQYGATWGTKGFMDETLNQFEQGSFDPKNLASETGKNTLFGTLLAGVWSIESTGLRILMSGAARGAYSTLEAYLRDKKIDQDDLLNIGANTILGLIFGLINAKGVTNKMRQERFDNFLNQHTITKMTEGGRMSVKEAEEIVKTINELGGLQQAPPAIVKQIMPREFPFLSRAQQYQKAEQIMDIAIPAIKRGEPILQTLINAIQQSGFPGLTIRPTEEVPISQQEAPIPKDIKLKTTADIESIETEASIKFFEKEADKWIKSADIEGKKNAYDYATRDFPELGKALREEFFEGEIPPTVNAYRAGPITEGIVSVFPNKETAQNYADRFKVENVQKLIIKTDNLVPSGSGSGEMWVNNEDIVSTEELISEKPREVKEVIPKEFEPISEEVRKTRELYDEWNFQNNDIAKEEAIKNTIRNPEITKESLTHMPEPYKSYGMNRKFKIYRGSDMDGGIFNSWTLDRNVAKKFGEVEDEYITKNDIQYYYGGLDGFTPEYELIPKFEVPKDFYDQIAKEVKEAKPEILTGYRGIPESDIGFGATEGEGIYVAETKELASFFTENGRKIETVKYKKPKNPLIVDEEPLPLLHEDYPLFEPIEETDSEWIKLNKQAAINVGATEENWGKIEDKIAKELTRLMKQRGYDAVKISSGGEKWTVILDENLLVKPEVKEETKEEVKQKEEKPITEEVVKPAKEKRIEEIKPEVFKEIEPLEIEEQFTPEEEQILLQEIARQEGLFEIEDDINDIITGKSHMRLPSEDVRTDWKRMLGDSLYRRIFRKDNIYPSPDEMASNLGITENELMDAIVERSKQMKGMKPQEEIPANVMDSLRAFREAQNYQTLPEDLRDEIQLFFRPPRSQMSRVFSLLGNKDTTVPLFKEVFSQWVKDGTDIIVEPYAGAFTLGTHSIKEAIELGLKEYHSNIFDKEKYLIVSEIQKGNSEKVQDLITKSVKEINNVIRKHSAKDPLTKTIVYDFLDKYRESYIGSNQWINYISKKDIGKQVGMKQVFQVEYAAFQKAFQSAFDEIFEKDVTDLDSAVLRTVINRMTIRSGTAQGLLRGEGFTSIENIIYGKYGMMRGIDDIAETFKLAQQNNVQVLLYNEDAGEFIKRFADYKPTEVGFYLDPPYISSAEVYKKEAEGDTLEELESQLERFADPDVLHAMNLPIYEMVSKGSRIAMTNDVNADYLYGVKNNIPKAQMFAYREGLTPTSLVSDPRTGQTIRKYFSQPSKERMTPEMEKLAVIDKIAQSRVFKSFIKNAQEAGYLVTKPSGQMVFKNSLKTLINSMTDHELGKINLYNLTKIDDMELQQISESINDAIALGGKIPTTKYLLPSDIVENLPKWEKTDDGWKKVFPTQFKEINLLDKVRPAWRVLEKINIPEIADKTVYAQARINSEFEELSKEIKSYRKIAKKISAEELFNAAENPDKVEDETIKKIISWHKKLMNDFADRLNIPYDRRIKNYMTHIFDRTTTEALKEEKGIPEDLLRAMEFIVPKEKWMPYLQPRLGRTEGLKKDFWKATESYINYALKKIHLDPVIGKARTYLNYLPPQSSKYVRKWIQEDLLGRPTDIDTLLKQTELSIDEFVKVSFGKFGLKVEPKNVFRRATNATITGLYDIYLGLYPVSAVKNFFQKVLVFPVVDSDMFVKGMTYGQLPEWRQFVMDKSLTWKLRKGAFIASLDESMINITQQNAQKALMFLFREADRDNIIRSFLSGYFEAKKYGLPEDIAIKRGDEVAKRTQYLYNTVFSPEAFRSLPGKALAMFTTWPINFVDYVRDLLSGRKSNVYVKYFKENPNLVSDKTKHLTEEGAGKKVFNTQVLKYLFVLGAAYYIQRKTRIKALNYVGITSFKNILYYTPTAIEIPLSILKMAMAFIEGDEAGFKREFNNIKPDQQISFIRFLKYLGVVGDEKDLLRAFFQTTNKPKGVPPIKLEGMEEVELPVFPFGEELPVFEESELPVFK